MTDVEVEVIFPEHEEEIYSAIIEDARRLEDYIINALQEAEPIARKWDIGSLRWGTADVDTSPVVSKPTIMLRFDTGYEVRLEYDIVTDSWTAHGDGLSK